MPLRVLVIHEVENGPAAAYNILFRCWYLGSLWIGQAEVVSRSQWKCL